MMRASLVVDRVYKEESSGLYFRTPDGVGTYWYDTLDELLEDMGWERSDLTTLGGIYYVTELEDF